MNVLFLEDERPAGMPWLAFAQAELGWLTHVVDDVDGALRALRESRCAVLFIAWRGAETPRDRTTLCALLHEERPEVGRIFVGAVDQLDHKLAAFDAGADDYLHRAADPLEFLARTRAVVRRSTPAPVGPADIRDLTVDPRTRIVSGPAGHAELTPTEVQLLLRLADTRLEGALTQTLSKEVLSRSDLHARNLLHRHMSNLRAKLRKVGAGKAIVRSAVGYVLECPLSTNRGAA